MARATFAAAPHLDPEKYWGLVDEWNVWIHYVLPGKDNGPPPYEICEGRRPNLRNICIHILGCPGAFKPMKGTPGHSTNKNLPTCIDGYFLGIQWLVILVLRRSDMKVVSVSRKKVVFYESMYITDPMDNPPNQHLILVTDDDTKTRANAKIPTFVKSITSPFEALHENAGEADPQTVTQLVERLIPTQAYKQQLEDMSIAKLQQRQDVPLRDAIVTRLKTKLPSREQHQHQDQDDDHCEVAKLKMQMPDDIAHPTVDVKHLKIKDAPIGTRVKIHTWRFDSAETEYDEEGEAMLPYPHGKPMFTYGQTVARGDAQHADQLRVRYDDGDLL